MVMYTAEHGETLHAFLERAGYTHLEHLTKHNKPTLIANCLSQKKPTPSYEDIPDEFKRDKKKGTEVSLPITALIRYFKHQSAEAKKKRAEAARDARRGSPGVKGGRVSKR